VNTTSAPELDSWSILGSIRAHSRSFFRQNVQVYGKTVHAFRRCDDDDGHAVHKFLQRRLIADCEEAEGHHFACKSSNMVSEQLPSLVTIAIHVLEISRTSE